jgi:hypothetical protein
MIKERIKEAPQPGKPIKSHRTITNKEALHWTEPLPQIPFSILKRTPLDQTGTPANHDFQPNRDIIETSGDIPQNQLAEVPPSDTRSSLEGGDAAPPHVVSSNIYRHPRVFQLTY